jgi:hypothetical protein
MRIALATWNRLPNLNAGDRAFMSALTARGVDAAPAVWDGDVDWSGGAFDAVVIRSCWDYHRRHDEFLAWITRLERAGVRILNDPELLRWNGHKGYLAELASRGIPVVPTLLADGQSLADSVAAARERGWRTLVIKPAVSASAEGVIVLSPDQPAPDTEPGQDFLIQPFIDTLRTSGELDLIYFSGEYSHAVCRISPGMTPGHAERPRPIDIPPFVREAGDRVIRALATTPAYCRVDLAIHEGEALLMEVELIEPDLFLDLSPGAPDRFAKAVLASLT